MLKLDSELEDILVESYRSTKVFAKVFFPERFSSPFSQLHDQIFDLIDSGEQRIVIAAPRGIGKTSIVGLALTAKQILFEGSKFIPYVSKSFDSSVLQTENLKMELAANELVKKVFGQVNTIGADVLDKNFSKKSWIARFREDSIGTLVYPRGANQQIRGVLYRNARPDLFVFDDFEDSDEVMNEELREKLKTRFFADYMKAVSRVDRNWRAVYIDTLKHEDALLQNLIDSKDWTSLVLEICDDELNSKAPEFITTEEIKVEYESHKEKGLLDVFAREFRNMPISKTDAVFRAEKFKYYVENGDHLLVFTGSNKTEKIPVRELTSVTIVDPAKTAKLSSADSAIVTVGIHRQSKALFVRSIIAGKFEPDDLMNKAFAEVQTYGSMILGVETTGIERWISQPFENEMRVRNIFAIFYSISASGAKKPERVASLAPYYNLGYIYHNKVNCTKLENQLLMFPRSKLWDVMDCLSHIIKLMDEFAYYFDPEDFDPEEEPEEEFRRLLDEDDEPVDFAVI
jgi:hypothetical protein